MLFTKKKQAPDPDSIMHENWKTNFGLLGRKRFAEEDTNSYSSRREKGKFCLSLKKENLFAWTLNPFYRYNDFCLEAEIGFETSNPYSAVGFIFRHNNDENFYYFLLSNRGYFRFDLVFNGNPMPFINWTHSPLITPEINSLMIIAHGSHFSFYIDDEWIAEMEDDALADGKIGFAAQNFTEAPAADFFISQYAIESRPLEVERAYARWTDHIPVKPDNRINLARTFFSMANFTSAAVQMKKVFKQKKLILEDSLFFAEILINLQVYDVALDYIEQAITMDPDNARALQEKANLFYLQNRFIEARDFTNSILERMTGNATLWNLLGNCEYSLGNWDKAVTAYLKAYNLQNDQPLFLVNAARALEMDQKKEQALEKYLTASRRLFQQEAYGDLFNILPRVTALDKENRDVKALTAKMLFHENKIEEAGTIIKELIRTGYRDSAIFYLAGILKSRENNREAAIDYLQQACDLEPGFYLNWHKLAENLYLAGRQADDVLARSLELAPEYAWSINLAGLIHRQKGDLAAAVEQFKQAAALAPGELDILLNLSDALSLQEQGEAAFRILDNYQSEDNHRLMNHRGNLYARTEKFQEAAAEYEKALKLDPGNLDYMQNLASVCIKLDRIMRAEELLLKLYEVNPTAAVINLVGNLALNKGELKRAEVSYTEALKLDPGNLQIHCNLASLFLHKSNYSKAKEIIGELRHAHPQSAEVLALEERLHKQFETEYHCDGCSRIWWAPTEIPMQQPLKLVDEPPGEAPAGRCPACGRTFCIACRKDHLKEDRFTCPDCGEFLKLSEDWLKYVLLETMEKAGGKA